MSSPAPAPPAASTEPGHPHLSDPALAPFLLSTFTPASYLNSVLPPLLPPAVLSPPSSSSSSSSTPSSSTPPSSSSSRPSAVPLAPLSSQTTTLLSTLDVHTQRLLTTLQTLTEEILRISPRLGYEVDLLRSDVGALGEELSTLAGPVRESGSAPESLARLQMLARVRERVEEVVRVFGDAMDWSLDEPTNATSTSTSNTTTGSSSATTSTNSATPPPHSAKPSKGQNPADEIAYLLASGELSAAEQKLAALRQLAAVFNNTVEGPARAAVVAALEERVKAARAKVAPAGAPPVRERMVVEGRKEAAAAAAAGGKGEGGYYGLIEQLKGLRGMT
ncbi:hypothetical protein EDC01DRAFT_721700 [Geopyxis carbonaria]|nr:hypothetical protein EDC01DRAFT_721700 [Geopyxis carbonaria]